MIDEKKLIESLRSAEAEVQKKIDALPIQMANLKNEKKAYEKTIEFINEQINPTK